MRYVPLLLLCLLACSPPPAGGIDAGSDAGFTMDAGPIVYPPLTTDEVAVLMARPYRLVVPIGYDAGTPAPLVMLLHGYTADGMTQDTYFKMSELAQARGFLLATPDGLRDSTALRYWNATDYCCGSTGTAKTDDVAYLTAIMNELRLEYSVDPKRVFFVGHSNGGFMSQRMACDRASRVAGVVSLAGALWKDETKCMPSEKVPILQVHGDQDLVVTYAGSSFYPGAVETVRDWAQLDGCDGGTLVSAGASVDLSTTAGAETKKEQLTGCAPGIAVELWTMQGDGHIPNFNAAWGPTIFDWLMAHPKP